MKTTKKIYDEMVEVANEIRNEKIGIVAKATRNRGYIPHFDTRDFTSKNLIYGIKLIPYKKCGNAVDGDHVNLGSYLTSDLAIPKYTFFRFRHMYRVLYGLCDECDMGDFHVKHMSIRQSIGPIINVLSSNDKYYKKFIGHAAAYQACIFLYRGENTSRLKDLARRFNERDLGIARAESEYRRRAEVAMWDRIIRRLG